MQRTHSKPAQPSCMVRRELVEAAIEALIAILDAIDGDQDLEDGHDREPDLLGMCNWQDEGDQSDLRSLPT